MFDEGPTSINGLNPSEENNDFPSLAVCVSVKGVGVVVAPGGGDGGPVYRLVTVHFT